MRNSLIASMALSALIFVTACAPGGTSGASPTPTATSATAAASPTATATAATTSPAGTPTSSPAGTGASPTGSPAATGTAARSSDVCSLATRADVEPIIGTLATQSTRLDMPMPGFVASACVYASNDGALTVALGPRVLGRTEFETGARLVPGATSVTGIGDVAFSVRTEVPAGTAGAASIVALKGSTYFTVQATSRSKSSDALLTAITELAKKVANNI